ncbi:hypothetical protein [Sorangium sp. So ce693]|uniref:hypothetical protein n=1 Tax=Sorangium sp. So ce693 TaxID=3133318 RepID=UPI003F5DF329
MSEPLLTIAFRVAKIVMRMRMRKPVADLIASLHSPPRALLGQRAWEAKSQILGYLLVDPRVELPAGFAVEPLTSDERALLSEAHGVIMQVNRACLAAVSDVAPYAVSGCDPYGQFGRLDVSQSRESFSPELLASLRTAMAATPAVQLFGHFGGEIHEEVVKKAGEYIERRLLSLDVDSVPQDLLELLQPPMRLGAQATAKLGTAVAAVRSSIRVVDQLLFQAFVRDRLFSFDESNVFAVPSCRQRGVGIGHVIESTLPQGRSLPLDSGEVVVLAGSVGTNKEGNRAFCSVGNMVVKFSQDAGRTMTVQLRELDDHACEFPELVASALALQGIPGELS